MIRASTLRRHHPPRALGWLLVAGLLSVGCGPEAPVAPDREEVVFWHFWGGSDRDVVEDVVAQFNASQTTYRVRAVAMPGNNLQAKLFLAVAGGDPPDLINQDDPVLADWAERGIIQPLDEIVLASEVADVADWMFPAARRLSTYDDRLYAVCNGLDIRALYYNATALEQANLDPPETLTELNRLTEQLSPASQEQRESYAFLPDTRRLWAWGQVFGGSFFDQQTGRPTANDPRLVAGLEWMQSAGRRYGPDNIAAFRQADQSLPGKTFPLLPMQPESLVGRYVMVMDGQWRVRDINRFTAKREAEKLPSPEFGVVPLPPPEGGRRNAGWVNGNFFVVPRGARQATGSWEFMKFWIGYLDSQRAARTCIAGGWIPVAPEVVNEQGFQDYPAREPLFATFVDLAASDNQHPIPQVPGASLFRREIEGVGYEAIMHPDRNAADLLNAANARIQAHLERSGRDR